MSFDPFADVVVGLDDDEFQFILEEVGAQLEAANMDLDNVESETKRITESVDKTVVESKRRLASLANRVRKTAQAMIFLAQVAGASFSVAFTNAIELVALSIELLTAQTALEASVAGGGSFIFGVAKVAVRIQLIAQLAAIQLSLFKGKEDAEISTERSIAGLYRVASYTMFPPVLWVFAIIIYLHKIRSYII